MIRPLPFGPGEARISSARASNGKFALAFQPNGFCHLYTVEGRLVRVLPRAIRSDTQPVFSRTSQDHVFTVDGVSLWRNSLVDDTVDQIATFPQFVKLTAAHAEGDLTPDGWLALCGVAEDGVEHSFVYNIHTQASGDVVQRLEPFDGLKAAYDGWLLISSERGIQAHPRVGQSHVAAVANGHACTTAYKGRPLLLWCNSAQRDLPADTPTNAIVMIDIPTGNETYLKSFDWAYAMHVSAGPDFAVISIYDPTTALPSQIWQAPFDGTAPTMLFEWYGPYNANCTPRASYSDGLVVFNRWDGVECTMWGLPLKEKPVEIPVDPPKVLLPVSLENEADADYVIELPIRGGKAQPWKMFKRTL